MSDPHRVILVGLGATGLAIGRALHRRADCDVVAAIDVDPAVAGRDLGALLGDAPSGVPVVAALSGVDTEGVAFALVATTSRLTALEPVVVPLLEAGINVVSICEELGFPQVSHPAIADRLDRTAAAHGVSILGTGCNPGFLMDSLPIALSALTLHVDHVDIRRTANMSHYDAIVRKFGLGLTVAEFDEAQAQGTVIGHVGFEQAAAALADGLGWEIDEIDVDPVRPAFVSPHDRRGVHVDVRAGTIAAVAHAARARRHGVTVIDLAVHFGIFVAGDPVEPGDRWRLSGGEQTIEITAERGFDSFLSTVAVAANVAPAVVDALPGLRTMADLPVRALACTGSLGAGGSGREASA